MDVSAASNRCESQLVDASGASPDSSSRLLSLPAELRTEIFTLVLADVRCRRPIVIWDEVCMSISGRPKPISTAILVASRTTNADCVPILYDNITVDISIRGDIQDQSFPRFQVCLGGINDCTLLSKLRHIELEVSYSCRQEGIARSSSRIQTFADACRKLKTISLTFFDATTRRSGQMPSADAILAATGAIQCERFICVARNRMAKRHMDPAQWQALRNKLLGQGEEEGEAEQFREISFDYFEHAFRQKN